MSRKRRHKLRISKREKTWRQLKQSQKRQIREYMYKEFCSCYSDMILDGKEPEGFDEEILIRVRNHLNGTGTRVDQSEMERIYIKNKEKILRRFLKNNRRDSGLNPIPEIIILGTGGAVAVDHYNTCFLLEDKGEYLLVDTGGGRELLRQLSRVKVPTEAIKDVFISHKHMDHIMGVFWLIWSVGSEMLKGGRKDDLRIYGCEEVLDFIRRVGKTLLEPECLELLDDRIKLILIKDGERKEIMGSEFTFFDLKSVKERQFGFTVTFSNDRKLSFLGDEPYRDWEKEYVQGTNWLLHEAFCLDAMGERLRVHERQHSTVKDASENAQLLEAENLILYHTNEVHGVRRRRIFTDEAKEHFDGKVFVPDDLERIPIS